MTTTTTERSRWIALYILCLGVLMIVLDGTVVNVALPVVRDDLGFTQANLAWVVNAYMIAFGGLLLLAGRLGDLIGQRRVFVVGLAIFTAASLLCALSQSQEMLIAARFVQGVGGALSSAVVLGMIVTLFPEPADQAKAIGIFGFVASAGGSIGLLAGGILTEAINWHWIFFINIPIGGVHDPGRAAPGPVTPRHRPARGRRRPRRDAHHRRPDARRVHDPGHRGTRLAGRPHAAAGRDLARAAGRVLRAPGPRRQPAHAAAPVPLAQRRGRQHRPGADRRRDVRHVLPGRAVPAGDPRLQLAGGRPGLPARDRRHGDHVGRLLGSADHALRRQGRAHAEPRADRRSACCCSPARRSTAATCATCCP